MRSVHEADRAAHGPAGGGEGAGVLGQQESGCQPQFRKTRSSQPRLKLGCACITMTTVITGTTQRRRAFRALFF